MLDRLEKLGCLERVYDKNDRRTINIKLTDDTLTMRETYNKVSEHMNNIFYENFSDEEIVNLK